MARGMLSFAEMDVLKKNPYVEDVSRQRILYTYDRTLQLLCGITFIPPHSFQELHDDSGIFGSLGTISQTAKKYFLVYQLVCHYYRTLSIRGIAGIILDSYLSRAREGDSTPSGY
ncbi:hypothetical protein [Anaerovibrio slackiae]|uniref:hypothetical protein n=1 Tax=Anaerovibrio slackiae TaxID=2652309 RepID=UPI003869DAFD